MIVSCPHVRIIGTGSYAPDRVVTNAELERTSPTNAAWVEENLGIRERRVAHEGQFASDLACEAAFRAIDAAGISVNDIGLIVVATATPDRKAPSTACILQQKLGITNRSPAFDIAAVCSGFVYGMTLAAQSVELQACNYALVVGVDTFSRITDWKDRNCVFFGDGAGAVVLGRGKTSGLFSSLLRADGRGMDSFTVYPYDSTFTMDGKAVYDTGTVVLPEAVREILALNKLSAEDVSLVVPHQPSVRVLRKTAEQLEIPIEKVKMNMDRYANTAGATVPLLLDEVRRKGEIAPNSTMVFAAVGSGWTWGAAVYRWIEGDVG